MSRFYFNFRQGHSYALDEEGCPFANVEDAYLGAVVAAQEMWRDLLTRREDPLKCAFEVRDENGNEMFTLPFSEVLAACGSEIEATVPRSCNAVTTALEIRSRVRRTVEETNDAAACARTTLAETIHLLRQVDRVLGGVILETFLPPPPDTGTRRLEKAPVPRA